MFRFESCWPAMARDASGVIFVYNPDQLSHDTELEAWSVTVSHLDFGGEKPRRHYKPFQHVVCAGALGRVKPIQQICAAK